MDLFYGLASNFSTILRDFNMMLSEQPSIKIWFEAGATLTDSTVLRGTTVASSQTFSPNSTPS